MNVSDVFRRITAHLNEAGIPFMLVGSFASTAYGASRSTRDIDLVFATNAGDLTNFVAALKRDDYYVELDAALDALRQKSMFNAIDNKTGWKIDFMVLKSSAFQRKEFERRRVVEVFDTSLWIASAEDVILSKLEWSKIAESYRQIEDVARLLTSQWDNLDQEYLREWVADLAVGEQWKQALQQAVIAKSDK